MPVFDNKIFNAEVFGSYVNRIPRVKQNKLLEAGVMTARNDIAAKFSDQSGGNYATVPMFGLIDGTPLNYDGETDITATNTKTYSQSMVVVGRAKGWIERDFSGDITSANFMDNVASQVAEYWQDVDQDTMLSILKGIFLMGANDFTINHTTNITTSAEPNVGATTLNTAVQKAAGDNKDIFKVAIMHSVVATNLENLNVIQYLKYTDAQGVQRDLGLASWNGRLVLIDDSVPTTSTQTDAGTAGAYTITVTGAGAIGDKITVDGIEYTCTDTGAGANEFADGNIAAVCTSLQTLLAAQYSTTFTVTKTSTTVVLTQKANGYGAIPVIAVVQVETTGTLAASIATTTAGVSPTISTAYTTYILGEGAFDYCDCGADVPYEMDRDPKTNGGQNILYTRQRKLFAPKGISFTKNVMTKASPTAAELENGSNWELVNDNSTGTKTYINHKAIPIARIVSLG